MTGKVVSAGDAVAGIIPAVGATVAVGGMHLHNNPMEMVFEVIRQKRRIGRLITSPSAALAADVLIGAGVVEEIATSYVGFEHLGLAPCFRRAVENGSLRVLNLDEAAITHGLYGGASGLGFVAVPSALMLSDVWRSNPETYRTLDDPFTRSPALVVRSIRPDVALVHAAEADGRGTAWLAGAAFTDRLMAMAATRVIVQVERVVSSESLARRPAGSTIPGFLVSAVVESPHGCLPTASHGNYAFDEAAIRRYLQMARTPEGFAEWMSAAMTAAAAAPA